MNYTDFLKDKVIVAPESGFALDMARLNPALKPHQADAVAWALRGGRRALFESFGMGKTVQEIEFCHQAVAHERGNGQNDARALIVLPLGVKQEFARDAVSVLGYPAPAYVRTMAEADADGRLPATFMVVGPGSWTDQVWDDINRMRTLNTTQSQRRAQMHVCPLQLDIVERLINRYSNKGDVVFDPFAGLFTVPKVAVDMGRFGVGTELNVDYFRDGVGYMQAADAQAAAPTMFDLIGQEA